MLKSLHLRKKKKRKENAITRNKNYMGKKPNISVVKSNVYKGSGSTT